MENVYLKTNNAISSQDLKNKTTLITKDVRNICQSIFKKHGINGFSYSRVFVDGSRSELWSNEDALYHTFLKKRYIADSYTPDNYKNDERYVLLANKVESYSNVVKEKYSNQLLDQKRLFNHDNCFMIVNKMYSLCEYFIFYTPAEFSSSINFYFNNLSELESFSLQFKESAAQLIKIADKAKIVKPWREEKNLRNVKIQLDFEKSQKHKIRLTKREIQLGQLIIQGKTAKEIAYLLSISTRTVESYIENIKDKLFCNRKADLIVKLVKLNIL